MTRSTQLLMVAILLPLACSNAQVQVSEFAAVSIKSSQARGPTRVEFKPGGRFIAVNASLFHLVSAAYGLVSFARLTKGPGCPDWVDSDRFDVEAVVDSATMLGTMSDARLRETLRPLLQQVLAQRFQLAVRRVPKDLPVYALTAAESGSRLTKAEISEPECASSGDCRRFIGGRMRGMRGDAVSLADLAFALETWADRPVLDQTAIEGLFVIRVRPFATLKPHLDDYLASVPLAQQPPMEENLPSLASVLEKDFGLIFRRTRAQVESLMIESVARPTPN